MTGVFKRQVRKDLEIVKQELSLDIDRIEWHTLDGIDDTALKFIREEMDVVGVDTDLFKVIVY